jgi:hypothetical protein
MDDSHQRFSRTKTRTHEQSKKKNKKARDAQKKPAMMVILYGRTSALFNGACASTHLRPHSHVSELLSFPRVSAPNPRLTVNRQEQHSLVGRHTAKRIRTISPRWADTHLSAGHWPGTRSVGTCSVALLHEISRLCLWACGSVSQASWTRRVKRAKDVNTACPSVIRRNLH